MNRRISEENEVRMKEIIDVLDSRGEHGLTFDDALAYILTRWSPR